MLYYLLKLFITAGLVVLVSEIGKRFPTIAGLIASLPLISYLAFIWMYVDAEEPAVAHQQIATLSWQILWLVIPSLSLFVALPLLLKKLHFVPSLLIATVIMFACYAATMFLLKKLGYATLTT